MWTSVKSLSLKWQLRSCLLALFWISLLTLAEAIPQKTSGIRSIYFRPYRYTTGSWESFSKEPDYIYDEHEYANEGPVSRPTEPYPEPEPMTFGGTFHVSRDRYVSFGASDVMVGRPPLRNTFHPHNYPTPIKTVPSASSPKFEPATDHFPDSGDEFRPMIPQDFYQDSHDSREYSTPTSLYYSPPEPTEPPAPAYVPPRPNPEVEFSDLPPREKKQDGNFKTKDESDANPSLERLISKNSENVDRPKDEEDSVSHHDNVPIREKHFQSPSILATLNKFSETTTAPPHAFDHITSHHPYRDFELETSTTIPILMESDDLRVPPKQPSAVDVPNGSRHESSLSSVLQPSSNTSGISVATDETQNSTIDPSETKTKGWRLSTGAIAGIVIGILTPLSLVAGAVVYLMYGRHFKNLGSNGDSRGTTDNCAYIDDSIHPSGYMNSHIELPKENSEEMTSLDNDSFLNSLEAVTIQNYWAESAKNTKV